VGYYIKVEPNVKIYVEDLNPEGKKTILFLHGWPGSHNLFEYQFDQLPKYGYRCIAIAIRYMARHKGYGVSKLVLISAAAPSLIKRKNFPYGLDREEVVKIIEGTYNDRPKMLRDFGDVFFFQYITQPFSDWFFQLGLQAAGWATAAIANTWIDEVLFSDLETINVSTLIIHGIHDKVVPFELGEIQNQCIRNSKLVPFKYSGHGSFYDQKEKFNEELMKFVEE